MIRTDHLQSARDFLTAVAILRLMPRQSQALAEMIWGATVAAISAADPEHDVRHHHAPNQRWSFLQAAQRIANPVLPVSALEQCLDNNQRTLHTHFYHGNLTAVEFLRSRNVGLNFVEKIIAVAEQSLP